MGYLSKFTLLISDSWLALSPMAARKHFDLDYLIFVQPWGAWDSESGTSSMSTRNLGFVTSLFPIYYYIVGNMALLCRYLDCLHACLVLLAQTVRFTHRVTLRQLLHTTQQFRMQSWEPDGRIPLFKNRMLACINMQVAAVA